MPQPIVIHWQFSGMQSRQQVTDSACSDVTQTQMSGIERAVGLELCVYYTIEVMGTAGEK